MRYRERGMTLLTVALCMFAIMAISALALDIGVLYTAHTSAQHAADAAALAGAFSFLDTTAPQPITAQNHAIAVAAQNKVLGAPVVIGAGDVVVDTVLQTVTVTVPLTGAKALPTYFAAAMGFPTMGVVAQAKAEAWRSGTASHCLKPIFIPNTVLAPNTEDQTTACRNGHVIFQQDANGNYVETAWAQGLVPTPAATPVEIRPINPNQALQPSQYYSLNLAANAPGGGAAVYECTLGSCLNDCGIPGGAQCGASYPVKTGNMVGPTVMGVNQLIGNPPDVYLGPGQYQSSTGIFDTSRSLAVAPVWDNCNPANQINPGYNGQSIKVAAFLQMFVKGMNGPYVQVYFINPISCDTSGVSGPGGPLTGPAGQPVRLIQNP